MDTSNGVPMKITPDCLVDAIVEFQVASDYKDEKVEEWILDSIKKNFPEAIFHKFPLIGPDKGKSVWADNVFRIYVGDKVISINIVSNYPGWDNVTGFLKGALQNLYENEQKQQLVKFTRVRINYVSHFPNVSIFDVWDGTPIQLNNIPPFVGREFNFKFGIYHHVKNGEKGEFVADAEVHLSDNLPIPETSTRYSRIDVGLQSRPCDGSFSDVFEQLQKLHFHEKEIFFKLLSKEFVDKLTPVWPKK